MAEKENFESLDWHKRMHHSVIIKIIKIQYLEVDLASDLFLFVRYIIVIRAKLSGIFLLSQRFKVLTQTMPSSASVYRSMVTFFFRYHFESASSFWTEMLAHS